MPPSPRITLLTDFGTADGYAAAMKGVIAAIAPAAVIDDAAHDIAPGDIRAAAWTLGAYALRYPRGSVHVVVVDPGVGSDRRALAADIDGRRFVAPDNGILTHVLHAAQTPPQLHHITSRTFIGDVVSATFHGRDVFAPAAAHLARGVPLSELGPAVHDAVRFIMPAPVTHSDGRTTGEVIHVDRFGNLITNLPAAVLTAAARVSVQGREVSAGRTYADVAPGEVLALVGSRGMIEISIRDGSAARVLDASVGTRVEVA